MPSSLTPPGSQAGGADDAAPPADKAAAAVVAVGVVDDASPSAGGNAHRSGPARAAHLVARAVLLALALALVRILGLPALWEAYPHLQPAALACFGGGGGRGGRGGEHGDGDGASWDGFSAPPRVCSGMARTFLANEPLNTTDLVVRQRRRPPTLTQAKALARCLGHWAPATQQDAICYLVRTGTKTRDRTAMIRNTWGRLVRTVWYISDAAEPEAGTITFPEIAGKDSDEDAQHRLLVGLKHIANSSDAAHCDFFWLADDDSFANPVELAALTEGLSPRWKWMVAYLWHMQGFSGFVTTPSGGLMYSRAAALAVAKALFTDPLCPFTKSSDSTLGVCNAAVNVTSVHSILFDPLADQAPGGVWYLMMEHHQAQWASLHSLSIGQIQGLFNAFLLQYGRDLNGDGAGDALTEFGGVDDPMRRLR